MTFQRYKDLWIKLVADKAKKIDPNNEEHWGSMALGFALALGVRPATAKDWATRLRYKEQLA